MKKWIFFILAIFPWYLGAQVLHSSALNSGGNYVALGSFSVEQSLGELAITSFFADGLVLTQGLFQPIPKVINTSLPILPAGISINIFPLPASSYLYINTNAAFLEKGTIMDLAGRELRRFVLQQNEIDLSGLLNGCYILRLYDKQDQLIYIGRFLKL